MEFGALVAEASVPDIKRLGVRIGRVLDKIKYSYRFLKWTKLPGPVRLADGS
jgi:hypothetical protein